MDEAIAQAVEVSQPTVFRVCRQHLEQGRAPAPAGPAVRAQADGRVGGAAGRTVLQPAAGRPGRWSLRLLADRLVELEVIDAVSYQTVRRVLKNALQPWRRKQWCIPPQANAEFVWRMEDVLDVYTRPYDPHRPLVCLDETSKQLLRDARAPLPPGPGQPARVDYEYERVGVVNLVSACEPLAGRR